MCGSYIHGRSWFDKVWKHICDPMRINSHNELMVPKVKERLLVPYDAAKIVQSAVVQKDAEVIKVAVMRGLPIPAYRDGPAVRDQAYEEHMIDLSTVRRIDFERNPRSQDGMDFFIVMDKPFPNIVDWGIRPWNGRFKIQRANNGTPDLFTNALSERFLPKTRADLIEWAKAHWGKRDDEGEFTKEMPQCLDYEKLKPDLPEFSSAEDVTVRTKLRIISSQHPDLIGTIYRASNPCDRFCEMFKEAPNAFWAERN